MLELRQELKLTQQLVMTPQLQQAIKLLQLGRLELVGLVQKELEENPVLEETNEGDDSLSATESRELEGAGEFGETSAEIQSELAVNGEAIDFDSSAVEIAADLAAVAAEPVPEAEPSHADKVADIDWENYMEAYPQTMRTICQGGEGDQGSGRFDLSANPSRIGELSQGGRHPRDSLA